MYAWTRGLAARAKFDNNDKLAKFVLDLESTIIETVESGIMTKDLAILVEGTSQVDRDNYVTTQQFIQKVADSLKLKMETNQSNEEIIQAPGGIIVVQAKSAGFEAGNMAEIVVNGERVKLLPNFSGHERGLHIVVIDQKRGEVIGCRVFDTYTSSTSFDQYI